MIPSLSLGAPGLYVAPDAAQRELSPERMDIAAFVGIAPRGPAAVPQTGGTGAQTAQIASALAHNARQRSVAVRVESWAQYKATFGAFEGPGRLPHAVASFFENGGQVAEVVRITHSNPLGAGIARLTLEGVTASIGTAVLEARSEGSWANHLHASLVHRTRPIAFAPVPTFTTLPLPEIQGVTQGALLRLSGPWGSALRFVDSLRDEGLAGGGIRPVAHLSSALPDLPNRVELIETDLTLTDESTGIVERHSAIGLDSAHPRWMGAVLFFESTLVLPTADWIESRLTPVSLPAPGAALVTGTSKPAWFTGGTDRYEEVIPEDFFDPNWDPVAEVPGNGIHALASIGDLSLICTPDLYVPEALTPPPGPSNETPLSNAEFGPCVSPAAPEPDLAGLPAPSLPGLVLDPKDAADRDAITALQARVVDLTDQLRGPIAMLDVPPGLTNGQILTWRTAFASPYAAAYHPWLRVVRSEDTRDTLTLEPPSAAAAGIVARQEAFFGLPHGPANALLRTALATETPVSPALHDQLHLLGLNILLQEREGIRLTAARTLSGESRLRQMSVVRLMVFLRRTLKRQMQWAVFEPNGPRLWADMHHQLTQLLRRLFSQGAFRGATESEAFFVRCDASLNTRRVVDAGRMLAEIGVAPAEPLEFIVLRLSRGADGTLSVEP